MAARAIWKGFLKFGEVTCRVGLYTAASTSERIAFHTINRATGHRVRRQFVDAETGDPVEKEDQVKGYETAKDEYVVLEPEEIADVIPESDKTLDVQAFIPCDKFDTVFVDRPYFMTPADAVATSAFSIVREGMRKNSVAALARAVLFRRMRSVLVRPYDHGLVAHTLHFDYEVRSAKDAFDGIPKIKIQGEMLDLARHIIETKRAEFDPRKFDDRYEEAVAELVKAKLEGKPLPARKERAPAKVINLMDALRKSAGQDIERAPRARKASRQRAKKPSRTTGKRAGERRRRAS